MSEAHNHETPSIPFEDLPDRLRRSRKRADWDQEEIADRLGVHYMTAYRYVRTGRLPVRRRATCGSCAVSRRRKISWPTRIRP